MRAIELAQDAITVAEGQFGKRHLNYFRSLENLGLLYQSDGRFAEAERVFQKSLVGKESLFGNDHPAIATTLSKLADLHLQGGRTSSANRFFERATLIISKNPDSLSSLAQIASQLRHRDQVEELEKRLKFELDLYEIELGGSHPELLPSLDNLGLLYKYQGRYEVQSSCSTGISRSGKTPWEENTPA